ncbi:unnamed protein product [Linum trigynum]|uniref:Uncharacterized protein n=1 Tax=Linum trigynum TaxID=586398 RepID=A0AAV2F5P5_9ROSI
MNPSKFFDSEWIRLSQRLQQSLDRYEREARERAAAEGEMVEMEASTAAGKAGRRRSAGLTMAAAVMALGDAENGAAKAAVGADAGERPTSQAAGGLAATRARRAEEAVNPINPPLSPSVHTSEHLGKAASVAVEVAATTTPIINGSTKELTNPPQSLFMVDSSTVTELIVGDVGARPTAPPKETEVATAWLPCKGSGTSTNNQFLLLVDGFNRVSLQKEGTFGGINHKVIEVSWVPVPQGKGMHSPVINGISIRITLVVVIMFVERSRGVQLQLPLWKFQKKWQHVSEVGLLCWNFSKCTKHKGRPARRTCESQVGGGWGPLLTNPRSLSLEALQQQHISLGRMNWADLLDGFGRRGQLNQSIGVEKFAIWAPFGPIIGSQLRKMGAEPQLAFGLKFEMGSITLEMEHDWKKRKREEWANRRTNRTISAEEDVNLVNLEGKVDFKGRVR